MRGARGARVEVSFADGTEIEADAVIGADGVHSLIRDHVAGPEQPRFIGRLAYRTTFPAALLRGVEIGSSRTKWWGPDRHIVIYFVTAAHDEVYFTTSQPEKADWITKESWSTKGNLGEMREAFAGFHPDVRAVLAAAPEVHKWGIFERDPLATWSKGRVCLLGDACHPMTPYMASGAAMALEDAAVLARCIEEIKDIEEAFRVYEATRKPRASAVQAGSSANTWMRNETNPDWLYGYDAWTAPLVGAGGSVVRSHESGCESRSSAQVGRPDLRRSYGSRSTAVAMSSRAAPPSPMGIAHEGGGSARRALPLILRQPRVVAHVDLVGVRRAVAIDHRRERAAGGDETRGHVAVGLRIDREIGRGEQLAERLRRLDRIEPVALVDGGALDDGPASAPALQPIEEARIGGHVGEHAVDLLAHQDDDIGLGHRALAGDAHDRGEDVMLGALSGIEALAATVDEFGKAPAEPGDGDLPFRHEGCEQLRPLALVAVEAPGLDQLGAGIFLVHVHELRPRSVSSLKKPRTLR